MADELLTDFADHIAGLTLIPSSGGVFEVVVNGDLVYSKKETGRHAKEGEVYGLVAERLETGE